MKKILVLALAAALALTVLTGCGKKDGDTASAKTPEELTQLYNDAITNNGGEMVEYNPVLTEVKEDDMSALVLETLGLKAEDTLAFGVSASMMNVQAYGIAAVMPAEGKTEAVVEGLQGFIDRQKQGFENYLVGEYEVASNAKLETLEDGTVLMVMSQDQDTIYDAIAAAIKAG